MNTLTKEEREREEYIREIRFQLALERFKDYEEYMEIPGYGETETEPIERVYSFDEYMENTDFTNNVEPSIFTDLLEKRFQAAVKRYEGMEEFMDIPDMNIWMDLKKEIQNNKLVLSDEWIDYNDDYSMDSLDKHESRLNRFIDHFTSSRRRSYSD